jgi:hypothetical protein
LKHEILGKPIRIAVHCLIEDSRLNAIQRGQITFKQDALAAHEIDHLGNRFDRNNLRSHLYSNSKYSLTSPHTEFTTAAL